jgi:hypothetical protein
VIDAFSVVIGLLVLGPIYFGIGYLAVAGVGTNKQRRH